MAAAAVISFEETRQSFAKPRARQPLHAYLAGWLDRRETHMPDDTPSLEALTQAVFARRQELTGRISQALVEQQHARVLPQRTMPCPQGQCLRPARPPPPRTVPTMVGAVSRSRPYCYGSHCQQGFSPLDEVLPLSERRTPGDLQQAGARLAAAVPLKTAQELFRGLTGLSLSDQTRHEVTGELSHAWGGLEVSPTAAEMAHRVAEMAAGKTWRPVMVWAIDGACVPTRPAQANGPGPGRQRTRAHRAGWQGAGQEAKGVRVDLVDQERIVPVLSWHQVPTDEEAAEALRQVKAAGLLPEDRVRWCGLGDGAKWIWKQVHAILPPAVQILDDDHCREHVHQGAGLPFGDDAEQEHAWVEAMMARLFWGDVDWAIEGLEALQPRHSQAAEAIRKLIGVLRHRAGRRHGRAARKGGYPIGSGGIEAAHTCISHVRPKRSGAWWDLEQANRMLALRCAVYHGTFARVFVTYHRRVLQRHQGNPL